MSGHYGGSEIAASYHNEILFEGATFNDLLQGSGPLAIVTGTDITTGSRFSFYQDAFDLICSDPGPVHLSRAAATSSAKSIALSPVTLNNYGGTCDNEYPPWVQPLLVIEPHNRPAGRVLERYRQMAEFHDAVNRPCIHRVGGQSVINHR